MEDRQLVKSVLRGNPGAFDILVQQHLGLVIHMIAPMVKNPEDREEIIQDVFLKVHQNLERFRFHSKLSTWIGQIAYRSGLNYLQKKRKKLVALEPEDLDLIFKQEDLSTEQKDASEFIQDLVKKIPPPYGTILNLFYLEEMSHREIMEVMELPEGTVKNYLFRAKKKMREMLEPILEKETGLI